jgi:hypothetical protein
MSRNTHGTAIVAICLGAILSASAFGQEASTADIQKKLQALAKTAQSVADVRAIENLMSIHAFQNKACMKPGDVDYQETVAEKAEGVCYGQDGKYLYDDTARKAMHGLDDPSFGKAGTLKMHMLTTALIQVAGDGQTAKGIWYSPGFLTEIGADGKPKSAWDFQRYGVDFIKEDGKWKIWHMVAYTDFVTHPSVSWTDKVSIANATILDQAWNSSVAGGAKLKAPVAYQHFADTFSYSPAKAVLDVDKKDGKEENGDIDQRIKSLEKKISKAADVQAIKVVMNSMQHHVNMMNSEAQKTPGRAFGQNDGYIWNFGRRMSSRRGGGPGSGPGPGAPGPGVPDAAPGPGAPGDGGPSGVPGGGSGPGPDAGPGPGGPGVGPGGSGIGGIPQPGQILLPFLQNQLKLTSGQKEKLAQFQKEVDSQVEKILTDAQKRQLKNFQSGFGRSGPSPGGPGSGRGGPGGTGPGGPGGGGPGGGSPPGNFKDLQMVAYRSWTPTTLPQYKPKPPVAYKTFSETFSYVPPMPEEIRKKLQQEGLMD